MLRLARSESGFTLVEVLVVLAIIGVLAAIAVPMFMNNKTKAYVANMESDLTNTGIILHQEWIDNGRVYAPTDASGVPQMRSFPAATQVSEETVMVLQVSPDATRACLVGWVKNKEDETKRIYDMQKRGLSEADRTSSNFDCLDPGVGWMQVATISG